MSYFKESDEWMGWGGHNINILKKFSAFSTFFALAINESAGTGKQKMS